MISKEDCQKIIDTAISHATGKADGIEIHVNSGLYATSRFANNEMTQNQAPDTTSVSVRTIVEGSQARLSSDKIGLEDVKQLVDNAITVTKLLEKDPKLLPLLGPQESTNNLVNRFDDKAAYETAEQRAAQVQTIIKTAKADKLQGAGTVSSGHSFLAIANSAGLNQYYRESEAECSITMVAPGSSGWAKAGGPFMKYVDTEAMAIKAAKKAVSSADPVEIEPGHYTVILEPSAVLDLTGDFWYDFAATSHLDKLSCFLGKVGKQVLGSNITIYDDVYHPLQSGSPFDAEGMPRKKVCLVEKGVLKNLVYGRRAAKEFSVEPTGHGLTEPNSRGEMPRNIVIEGGNSSLDEMIRSTNRGVLLTRVWYVREVDESKKIVTGMTRDGTFLVENGKIKCGVKNLRFNESIIEMLNKVEMLGPTQRTLGEESSPAVVPAMKVAYFNFESTTKF